MCCDDLCTLGNDLDRRPQAYESCALTNWATPPRYVVDPVYYKLQHLFQLSHNILEWILGQLFTVIRCDKTLFSVIGVWWNSSQNCDVVTDRTQPWLRNSIQLSLRRTHSSSAFSQRFVRLGVSDLLRLYGGCAASFTFSNRDPNREQ